jgi:hypothetical protein
VGKMAKEVEKVFIYIPKEQKFIWLKREDFNKFLTMVEIEYKEFFLNRYHEEQWLEEFKKEEIFRKGGIKDLLEYYNNLKKERILKEKKEKEEKKELRKEIKELVKFLKENKTS